MTDIILGAALDHVVAAIAAKFPTYKTVVAEDQTKGKVTVPAILINFVDLEPAPDADASTDQWPCYVRFEASIILGLRTPKIHREIAQATAALAAFIHNNRLTVPWGAGQVLAAEPDEFAPNADQYHVWRVEWQHQADLGDVIWTADGIAPTEVLLSFVPAIGNDHEADYIPVVESE